MGRGLASYVPMARRTISTSTATTIAALEQGTLERAPQAHGAVAAQLLAVTGSLHYIHRHEGHMD